MLRRRLASVEWKLTAVIASLAVVSSLALGIALPVHEVSLLRERLEHKALTLARLTSHEVESAIAFGDAQTAREVFEATTLDSDVLGLSLWREDGTPLYRSGLTGEPGRRMMSVLGASGPRLEKSDDLLRVVAPVTSKEGPRGVLVVELSLASVVEERSRLVTATLWAGLAIFLFGVVAARIIAHSIARRVKRLAESATRVAEGDLAHAVPKDGSEDEIGQLTRAFSHMVDGIRALVTQNAEQAKEENARLEVLVRQRTSELDARNRAMRLVLEHVGQGFLTIDARGEVSSERSAILETWFGVAPAGITFGDYIGQVDPRAGEEFADGWSQGAAGVLPLVLVVDQLPSFLRSADRFFRLTYKSIGGDGERASLLIVVSDITVEVQKNKSEEAWRELGAFFERVLTDRAGAADFLADAGELVDAIEKGNLPLDELRRAIHTLKGNSDLMGLSSLAAHCHRLEDGLAEGEGRLAAADVEALVTAWKSVTSRFGALFGERTSAVSMDRPEYRQLIEIAARGSRADFIAFVQRLAYEPTARRLGRIADQAVALGARLGKRGLVVSLEPNGLRLPPGPWAPFWSAFVHVVRNAVDHGIELPQVRTARGKAPTGHLRIRTEIVDGELVIEMADDGRGIDWSSVRERALREGLATATRQDLEAALFEDGFSTAAEVTDLSGRGVGLGAVRQACDVLGGTIAVQSLAGEGTTFHFRFPAARARSHRITPLDAPTVAP